MTDSRQEEKLYRIAFLAQRHDARLCFETRLCLAPSTKLYPTGAGCQSKEFAAAVVETDEEPCVVHVAFSTLKKSMHPAR